MPRMTMKAGHLMAETVGLCARLAFALATLLFLAPLTIGEALGSNCESSYRISHSNSDCMHAWWDNSPSSTCWGTKGGAQSFCSNYGSITVKVDIIGGSDIEVERNGSGKWRYTLCTNDTRQISCCIDKSDLCKKSQVEPSSSGYIDHYNPHNNTWESYSVSTHEDRYKHCDRYSNESIYCDVDPKGDAFTEPTLCDGEECAHSHCSSYWSDSSADDTCRDESMGSSLSDVFNPTCTVSADCLNDDGDYVEAEKTDVMYEMDELRNCNGEIKRTC